MKALQFPQYLPNTYIYNMSIHSPENRNCNSQLQNLSFNDIGISTGFHVTSNTIVFWF